jgi:hypothetical protein
MKSHRLAARVVSGVLLWIAGAPLQVFRARSPSERLLFHYVTRSTPDIAGRSSVRSTRVVRWRARSRSDLNTIRVVIKRWPRSAPSCRRKAGRDIPLPARAISTFRCLIPCAIGAMSSSSISAVPACRIPSTARGCSPDHTGRRAVGPPRLGSAGARTGLRMRSHPEVSGRVIAWMQERIAGSTAAHTYSLASRR